MSFTASRAICDRQTQKINVAVSFLPLRHRSLRVDWIPRIRVILESPSLSHSSALHSQSRLNSTKELLT